MPVFERWKLEDLKFKFIAGNFKASLGCVRACVKKKKKKEEGREVAHQVKLLDVEV